MIQNPHAHAAMAYLDELCTMIDRKKRLRRPRRQWWSNPLWIPVAAAGMVSGLLACSGSVDEPASSVISEVCDDKEDNDEDGKTDCGDPDCNHNSLCLKADYAAPFQDAAADADDASADMAHQEVCYDDTDNDLDGKTDCDDPECFSMCNGTEYAGPLKEICDDKIDNDRDGLTDCGDQSDCRHFPGCLAPGYAAPF